MTLLTWLLLSACSRDAEMTGIPERCNGLDDDGDGLVDDGILIPWYRDDDGDGWGAGDPAFFCDVGRAWSQSSGDCDDTSASVNPGADDVANGSDDDCDGEVDDTLLRVYYDDVDGDGYGDDRTAREVANAPEGAVTVGDDCNDADATVNPGAWESCNEIDDDCDGESDEGLGFDQYDDLDGDGLGDDATWTYDCALGEGRVTTGGDCDDDDPTAFLGAEETCNDHADNDCDDDPDDCRLVGELALADADWRLLPDCFNCIGAGGGVAASDVDGDGVDDLVAGWPRHTIVGLEAIDSTGGAVVVYRGDSSLVPDWGDSRAMAAEGDAHGYLLGARAPDDNNWDAYTGTAVAVLDLDLDGTDDVVAAAPRWEPVGSALAWLGPIGTGESTASFRFYGEDASVTAVVAAGDLTGDGYPDLVVATDTADEEMPQLYWQSVVDVRVFATPVDGDRSAEGDAYATIEGLEGSFHAGAVASCDAGGDGLDDLVLASGGVRVIEGPLAGSVDASSSVSITTDFAGGAVSCADLDGDGYADVLAGNEDADRAGEATGAIWFVPGPITVSGSLTDYAQVDGAEAGDALGAAVAALGDMDGDGVPEFAAGAPGCDPEATGATPAPGAVYLFHGPAGSGFALSDAVRFSGELDDAAYGGEGTAVGYAFSDAGDLNGDGYADLAVGATEDSYLVTAAFTWVILGRGP